jgi:hypothetical protein
MVHNTNNDLILAAGSTCSGVRDLHIHVVMIFLVGMDFQVSCSGDLVEMFRISARSVPR